MSFQLSPQENFVSQSGNINLVPLGTLSLSHDGSHFAVRGRIAEVTQGDDLRLRLRALEASSPSTSINVVLRGRWCIAAPDLTVGICVQVDCAAVRPTADAGMEVLYLELQDPTQQMGLPPSVALHVINEETGTAETLSYVSLNTQRSPSSTRKASREGKPISMQSGLSKQDTNSDEKTTHTECGGVTEYVYSPVLDAYRKHYAGAGALNDAILHIFGVVVNCRAPSITTGSTFRCEVTVVDESSVDPRDPAKLKTVSICCEEENPENCIPFRAVGDIVRARHLHFREQRHINSATTTVIAESQYNSSFLMWSSDPQDFHPIACKDPGELSRIRSLTLDNVRHVISPEDRSRIISLRKWTQEVYFRSLRVHRPLLTSVLDVKAAHPSSELFSDRVDLLCRVEKEYTDPTNKTALNFVVSDGLLSRENGGQSLLVESGSDPIPSIGRMSRQFLDFCPSWEARPSARVAGMWLLIRDALIAIRGADRVVTMAVNDRTTTLLWLPSHAPEVLEVSQRPSRRISSSALPPFLALSSTVDIPLQAPTHAAPIEPSQIRQTAVVQPVKNEALSQGSDNSDTRSVPLKRRPRSSGLRPPKRSRVIKKSSKADASRKEIDAGNNAVPRNESLRMPPNGFPLHTKASDCIITHHAHQHLTVSTISELKSGAQRGNMGPYRLQVRVRALIAPRDVRFACKPWCNRCEDFLKVDPNHRMLECLKCSETYNSASDPATQWAYSVKLALEDNYGDGIECAVDGKEAGLFFSSLTARNLLSNAEARQRVRNCLQEVLDPQNIIDCSVVSLVQGAEGNTVGVACKIFGTMLLLESCGNGTE